VRRGALLLLGAAAAVLASCAIPDTTPKRFAVCFGVANYVDAPLLYTAVDAVSMGNMFTGQGFDDVTVKTNSQATRAELLAQASRLASLVGPDDLFVFYFSGHGGSDGTHEYFFPYDGSVDPFAFIRDDELAQILAPIRTARKVIILDSCNSGGLISNGAEADKTPASVYYLSPGVLGEAIQRYAALVSGGWPGQAGMRPSQGLVLAAAGAAESSYEDGVPYEHGIFTYYLLQAPQYGDLNGDGYVTAVEMFALAYAGVTQTWDAAYPGQSFAPHISGGPIDLAIFGP
jgi:uncharacterized caspase-like protein